MRRVTGRDLGQRMRARLMLREQTRELRPRDAAYLVIAVWFLAVVLWGTIEHFLDKETFPTVWLGMWWALQTVTTVGYGDVVPKQGLGRAVASVLVLGGLAFISVITATITSGFVALRERQAREAGEDPVVQRLDAIAARLDGLERQVSALRGSPPPDG
jgi:voltage-gated potassium channel